MLRSVESEIAPADRPGSFVLRKDGMEQSHVDLADPTRLVFDYVRRLAEVVDEHRSAGEPVRAVHLGGAGLTLPRYVAATRPRSWQVVLEPDEEQTALVRERLPLPARSGIRIRPLDGRSGLAGLRDGVADLVILDAFEQGRVPADLVTVEAYAEVDRVLAPGGRLAVNLVDRAPFTHTRRVLAGIRERFPAVLLTAEPATLRGRRQGNLVVVAGGTVPEQEMTARAATRAAPYRVLGARAVSDSFGGGRPFTDQDARPGPRPEPVGRRGR